MNSRNGGRLRLLCMGVIEFKVQEDKCQRPQSLSSSEKHD